MTADGAHPQRWRVSGVAAGAILNAGGQTGLLQVLILNAGG
ncbi:hypothetical protein [Klebsiella pneumoniae]|nr:hypothetical protein [Klebsiella pneumoniae]